MPGRSAEAKSGARGSTVWNDGLHSLDGGSTGGVSSDASTAPEVDARSGEHGSTGGGRDVTKAPWFNPVDPHTEVSDCPGGVCPVPWAVTSELKEDEVNHPVHYTVDGGIECIEAIEAQLTPEEYRGYLKGNIAKYVWRERHKGGVVSLKKAQWYLDRLVALEDDQNG